MIPAALVLCTLAVCATFLAAYLRTLEAAREAWALHHKPAEVTELHALRAEVFTVKAELATLRGQVALGRM